MKRVSLSQLPVSQDVRRHIRSLPHAIDGAAVYLATGSTQVFGPGCKHKDEGDLRATHPRPDFIYSRLVEGDTKARTMKAVELVEAEVAAPVVAARIAQVSSSAVYRELKRRSDRGVCRCCGQVLPKVKP